MAKKDLSLSTLKPLPGARKSRVRVGRGEGSGLGKTSGKGGKGQTARAGGSIRPGFEGGQTPLYKRIPKVGFRSRIGANGQNKYNVVRLSVLERLDDGATVNVESIKALGYGLKSGNKAGIKILADEVKLTKKLVVTVHAVSAAAREQIEAAGGRVELING